MNPHYVANNNSFIPILILSWRNGDLFQSGDDTITQWQNHLKNLVEFKSKWPLNPNKEYSQIQIIYTQTNL